MVKTLPIEPENQTVGQLLAEYGGILDELRRREIVRSTNNPSATTLSYFSATRSMDTRK
jgi:hypothetical protein